MELRDELAAIALRLHGLLHNAGGQLSQDERTALLMSIQLLDWAAKAPEEVRVVTAKPAITFSAVTLGTWSKE